jgi:hypothetical protein
MALTVTSGAAGSAANSPLTFAQYVSKSAGAAFTKFDMILAPKCSTFDQIKVN